MYAFLAGDQGEGSMYNPNRRRNHRFGTRVEMNEA